MADSNVTAPTMTQIKDYIKRYKKVNCPPVSKLTPTELRTLARKLGYGSSEMKIQTPEPPTPKQSKPRKKKEPEEKKDDEDSYEKAKEMEKKIALLRDRAEKAVERDGKETRETSKLLAEIKDLVSEKIRMVIRLKKANKYKPTETTSTTEETSTRPTRPEPTEEEKQPTPRAMKEVGTKKEVYNDKARRTKKGLTKNDLEVNAKGSVVQKKRGSRPTSSTSSTSSTSRKPNPWLEHLKKFRASHPNLSYKEALQQAKTTYKKGETTQPPRQEPREQKQREQKTRDEPDEEKAPGKPEPPETGIKGKVRDAKKKGSVQEFKEGETDPVKVKVSKLGEIKKKPSPKRKAPPQPTGIKGKVRDAKKKEPIQQLTLGETEPVKLGVAFLEQVSKKPTKRLPMRPVPSRPQQKLEPQIPDKPRESSRIIKLRYRNKTFEKGQVYEPYDYLLVKIGDRTKKSIKVEIKNRKDGTIKKATVKVGNYGNEEWLNLTNKMTGDSDIRLNASNYEKSPPATEKQKELLLTKGTPLPTDIIKYISGMAKDTSDLKFVKGKYYRLTDQSNRYADDILFRYEGGGNFRDYVSGNVYKARLRGGKGDGTASAWFTMNLYDTGYTDEDNFYYRRYDIFLDSINDDVVTRFDMRRKEDVEERLRKRQEPPEEKQREEKQREEKTRDVEADGVKFEIGAIYYSPPDDTNLRQRLSEVVNGVVEMDEGQMIVEAQELRNKLAEVKKENEDIGYKIIKEVVGGTGSRQIARREDKVYKLQALDNKDPKNESKTLYKPYELDQDGNEIIVINEYVTLNAKNDKVELEPKEQTKGRGLNIPRTYGGGLSRNEHHWDIINRGIVRY